MWITKEVLVQIEMSSYVSSWLTNTQWVEELVEKLKPENWTLHGQLMAEKLAHARALLENVCLQQDMKKVFKGFAETVRLLIAEHAKHKIGLLPNSSRKTS